MAMKGSYLHTILIVMLMACEESIDRPVPLEGTDTLIVEGILTNELKSHVIKLSHPRSQNGSQVPAAGATLQVIEGNTTYLVNESPVEPGSYITQEMQAVFGKTYTVHILYQGKEYKAQDSSVPVEPLPGLNYRKEDDRYILNRIESGSSPNFTQHDITWKKTHTCAVGESCEGKVIFYDLKSIDVNDLFKPGQTEFAFPGNATIIRKKYSCSPAFQNFLRSMLSETEWRGGVFDVQRANASTNLTGGAMGFFAVSTVLSDTTIISP
jgi:Domain of unknown function (DUF4249)